MADSERRRGRLQFSLRGLLVLMTVSAFVCGLLFAAPAWVGLLLVVFQCTAMPVAVTVMIIYGRGYLRTFAIGAMFPGFLALFYSYAVLLSGLGDLDDESLQTRLMLAAYLVGLFVVMALYGGTAMVVRWLVERWQSSELEPLAEVPRIESPFDEETGGE